jgi:hypothetical protein
VICRKYLALACCVNDSYWLKIAEINQYTLRNDVNSISLATPLSVWFSGFFYIFFFASDFTRKYKAKEKSNYHKFLTVCFSLLGFFRFLEFQAFLVWAWREKKVWKFTFFFTFLLLIVPLDTLTRASLLCTIKRNTQQQSTTKKQFLSFN